MNDTAPITVVITAHNAESDLRDLLSSLSRADDVIVVLDTRTTDCSMEVAEGFPNTRVYQRQYRSQSDQLNWVLDSMHSNPWVLVLDVDERIDADWDAVRSLVARALKNSHRGVALRRMNYFGEKWLKHGGFWPDWQVRLFRRDLRYEPSPIHSHVEIAQQDILFARDVVLRHAAYVDVDHYLAKLVGYVRSEAELIDGRSASFRPRFRRLRLAYDHLPFRSLVRFAYMYFVRLGFLDGWIGFYVALWSAQKDTMISGRRRLMAKRPAGPSVAQVAMPELKVTDERESR